MFAQAVHEASESTQDWKSVISRPDKFEKKVSGAKKRLNSEIRSEDDASLAKDKIDPKDEVIGWLQEIGKVLRDETNDRAKQETSH